eukprot:m.196735 g.196735  ORF g.196735 m.196735 type:complete len:65 (+) comp14909_c1_seq16:2408-2602(+)
MQSSRLVCSCKCNPFFLSCLLLLCLGCIVDLDDEGEDSRFSDILPTPQQSPSTPLAVDASASSA